MCIALSFDQTDNYLFAQKLGVFQLEGAEYVNVDLSTKDGIGRASSLGIASGHVADVIVSPHFNDVASRIFTPSDQGRMFALFRHPGKCATSSREGTPIPPW